VKKEAERPFEEVIPTYQTTRHHIPEYTNLHNTSYSGATSSRSTKVFEIWKLRTATSVARDFINSAYRYTGGGENLNYRFETEIGHVVIH
jgi:hypothetical protein